MRSAVRPWAPQLELYLSLRGQLETVLRNGGAQRVATHPLEAVPLAGRHAERGMEIEAVVARLTRPEPWRVGDGGQGGAAATDPTVVGGAFSVQTRYVKRVFDPASNQNGGATTWMQSITGTHVQNVENIVSGLLRLVDQFLTEYLRVNEAACNATGPIPDGGR